MAYGFLLFHVPDTTALLCEAKVVLWQLLLCEAKVVLWQLSLCEAKVVLWQLSLCEAIVIVWGKGQRVRQSPLCDAEVAVWSKGRCVAELSYCVRHRLVWGSWYLVWAFYGVHCAELMYFLLIWVSENDYFSNSFFFPTVFLLKYFVNDNCWIINIGWHSKVQSLVSIMILHHWEWSLPGCVGSLVVLSIMILQHWEWSLPGCVRSLVVLLCPRLESPIFKARLIHQT